MPAMRRLMTTICYAAILTMLLPTVAGAAVYRVNTDGSGDFESIGEALATAISSDVIELSDGTFSGTANRNLEFSGKAITLRSASGNPQACVIDVGASPGDPARAFSFRAGLCALALRDRLSSVPTPARLAHATRGDWCPRSLR